MNSTIPETSFPNTSSLSQKSLAGFGLGAAGLMAVSPNTPGGSPTGRAPTDCSGRGSRPSGRAGRGPRCSPSKRAGPMTRSRNGSVSSPPGGTAAPASSRSRSARAKPYRPSGNVGGISATVQESRGLSDARVSSMCQSPSSSRFSRYRTQPVTLYTWSSRPERVAHRYCAFPVRGRRPQVFRMVEMYARLGVMPASDASVFSVQR